MTITNSEIFWTLLPLSVLIVMWWGVSRINWTDNKQVSDGDGSLTVFSFIFSIVYVISVVIHYWNNFNYWINTVDFNFTGGQIVSAFFIFWIIMFSIGPLFRLVKSINPGSYISMLRKTKEQHEQRRQSHRDYQGKVLMIKRHLMYHEDYPLTKEEFEILTNEDV